MKKFLSVKAGVLLAGFLLLAALPFAIVRETPQPLSKNDTINPYSAPDDEAAAYMQKASEYYFYRKFSDAAINYRKAIKVYEDRKDFMRVAKTYESLGDLYVWASDYEPAEESYLEAVRVHADLHNALGEANALKELGDMHMKLDQFSTAEAWYNKSLTALQGEPVNRVLGNVQEGLGHLYWQDKRLPQAIDAFTQARGTYNALHYGMGVDHMNDILKRLATASRDSRKSSL